MVAPDEDETATFLRIQNSDEELVEEPTPNSSPRNRRRAIMLGVILVVGMIVGSLAIFKAAMNKTPAPEPTSMDQLFDAEISGGETTCTEFMTGRRLAATVALNFETSCPGDQPICNPEVVFASDIQKLLHILKEHAPEVYNILANNKLTKTQQEIIMRLLPMAHNMKVLELGEIVAETVKRWHKSGSKVVHKKVKEAMNKYLQEHGSEGVPTMPDSQDTGNSSMWLSRLEPDLLSVVRQDGESRRLQLSQTTGSRAILLPIIIGAGVLFGIPIVGGLLYLIFEILNYAGVLELPDSVKYVSMWIKGVTGSIQCLTLAACPVVFLSYWFDAFMLYGHDPKTMKGIPWDFMLKHLPGLNPNLGVISDISTHVHGHLNKRRLMVADPRIAA